MSQKMSARTKAFAASAACCASLAAYEAYRRGWFAKTTQVLKNVVETTQDTAEVSFAFRARRPRSLSLSLLRFRDTASTRADSPLFFLSLLVVSLQALGTLAKDVREFLASEAMAEP